MIITVNFQFKQLERRSLKKIRASTGFEPVTSAVYSLVEQCGKRLSEQIKKKCIIIGQLEIIWNYSGTQEEIFQFFKFKYNLNVNIRLDLYYHWRYECH